MDVERLFLHRDRLLEIHLHENGRERPARALFHKLKSMLEEKTVVLYGLRGVGKTVLMLQLVKYLLSEKSKEDVMYISADHFPDLEGAVHAFLEYHGFKYYESVDRPLYLFLDEVHYFPRWDLLLKRMHDASDMLHVFATGSSALRVLMSPDLYRRAKKVHVPPLFFHEYLVFRAFREGKKSEQVKRVVDILGKTTTELFVDYLLVGGFPFFSKSRAETYERVRDVVDRVLWKDIGSMAHPNQYTFLSLLHYLSSNVPGPLSYDKISRMLGISKSTVEKYLTYMVAAGLLIRVEHCRRNRPLRPSKYYFASPSIVSALNMISPPLGEKERGVLLETYVAGLLRETCYQNTDFVWDKQRVEVGWGKKKKGEETVISVEEDGVRPWELEAEMLGEEYGFGGWAPLREV